MDLKYYKLYCKNCKNIENFEKAKKGTSWFNNGKINIRAKECSDGFVLGRLRKCKKWKNFHKMLNIKSRITFVIAILKNY